MINTQATGSNPLGAIEITPLIDIVFIVIVFLLVTANTPLLSLPVNVPAADKQSVLTASDVDTVAITINVTQPYWYIEQQSFAQWPDFKQALLARITQVETGLTIAVDKAAPTEPLLKLLSLLNEQNISTAKIIMQQPSE
jgi:biopolymer transport protein ExbD